MTDVLIIVSRSWHVVDEQKKHDTIGVTANACNPNEHHHCHDDPCMPMI